MRESMRESKRESMREREGGESILISSLSMLADGCAPSALAFACLSVVCVCVCVCSGVSERQ